MCLCVIVYIGYSIHLELQCSTKSRHHDDKKITKLIMHLFNKFSNVSNRKELKLYICAHLTYATIDNFAALFLELIWFEDVR